VDRRQARRAGSAFGRLRHAAASVAAAVLIGAVSAPAASAGLVERVADTVGSTVKSVQAGATAVNAVPSLPSAPPPAKPSSPSSQVATPAPPPQAPPRLPSKELLPSKEPSAIPSRDGAGSADPASVDEAAGTARGVVDSVTSAGSEAATGAVTRERSDDGPALTPQRGADRSASEAVVGRGRTASSSPPVAVRAAEVAALQRWLARVWPAVSLGGSGVIGARVAEVIAGDLFRPALAAVTGLMLASSSLPITQASGAPPLAGGPAVPNTPQPAPTPVPAADGGSLLYLLAVAGLLGLLAFTVWREFDVALRPWQHRH
jgi:hypothetical protein